MESRRGRNHPLDPFRGWLDEKLFAGYPKPDWTAVQIAGTNGKGSVCSWLKTIFLQKNPDLKIGIFTSPHLLSHMERIRINDQNIPEETWEKIYDENSDFFQKNHCTMFEMDLWMALEYFLQERPDLVLFEVGMGGERDATTALDYDLKLITNIGLDHMAFLGNTKEEIAAAKAKIARKNIPMISSEKDPACQEVIRNISQEQGTQCSFVSYNDKNLDFDLDSLWPAYLPEYQKDNFILALAAAQKLGCKVSKEEIPAILESFSWPGRFTILRKSPLVVLDGAHNLPGIEALSENIDKFKFNRVYFSVLADKQGEQMIDILKYKIPDVRLVRFDSYRIADLEALAKEKSLPLLDFSKMLEEIQTADRPVLICGSLYFASEVLRQSGTLSAQHGLKS